MADNLHEEPDKFASACDEESDRTASACERARSRGHPEFEVCRLQGAVRTAAGCPGHPTVRRLTGASAQRPKSEAVLPLLFKRSGSAGHTEDARQCSSSTAQLGRHARTGHQPFGALAFGFFWTASILALQRSNDVSSSSPRHHRCKTLECHPSKPGFGVAALQAHRTLGPHVMPSPTIFDMLGDFQQTKSLCGHPQCCSWA